ncbi:glycosyltransferase [Neobacillus notoginsengisoli]|uniref:Glycosyltransferase n=1 Tax=Neobacillus notoginsengisoli TaxID=1578198 RepID=A0A417YH29_9BACI|nr:glycosyltransferase [Neobacillus notoginsengisoli]RHW32110.1 glycosyltransferase [Neobacillus notoginsengisoli]
MRVLQINSVCGIGSTGRIATDIQTILVKHGHESYIGYGRNNPGNNENVIRIGTSIDNYLHVAKTRITDKHGFGSKRATKKFLNRVSELNPDIIHLHNIHGYYLNIELLFEYLKKNKKPVIWTLHDCWPFTGHCTYFDYSGCECWDINGEHKCIQKKSYPSSYLFNNSKNNYARKKEAFTGVNNLIIVTPSEWLAKLAKKTFLSEYPIKVINNGIDLEKFRPMESNFREKYSLQEKFIILGVASEWTTRKGYGYFLDLSNNLSSDQVLVMIGLNNTQIKSLPGNIVGLKRTNNLKELAEIYSTSDVYINPTLEDNFPTTNIEALACGTPVITFKTGGSYESIDEKSGYIIENKSINELIHAIKKVQENGKKSYQSYCIDRAKAFYNKEDRFMDYIDLYQKFR